MPIHKPRLSRAEEAKYLTRLRQMQAEGLDVEIPEDWQDNSRTLDIVVAGPEQSTVFESASGGVCYAVLARVVAERPGLILTEWSMSTVYDQQIVAESFDDRGPECKLGGQVYRTDEVLNHRIEKGLRLSRGTLFEGWLLATGITPIPAEYRNFAIVPFGLSFWDRFGNEYAATGQFSVVRKAQRDNTGLRRGPGLYGLDEAGKLPELSIEEEARRRYLDARSPPGSTGRETRQTAQRCRRN
jgi:hypothetical protein